MAKFGWYVHLFVFIMIFHYYRGLRYVDQFINQHTETNYETNYDKPEFIKPNSIIRIQTSFQGLHILENKTGSSAILIKRSDNESDKVDDSHFKDDDTKNQLIRIITTFLNKPLREMLDGWLENLGTEGLSKQVAGIKAEIEAICKQMEFDDCAESATVSVSPVVNNKSLVPDDVKDYLFR